MIQVIVFFHVNDGQAGKFRTEFGRVATLVREEDGCIRYDLATDVDSGLEIARPPRHDCFTLHEEWQSLEHLQAHLATDHMSEFRDKLKDVVADMEIYVSEPVDYGTIPC